MAKPFDFTKLLAIQVLSPDDDKQDVGLSLDVGGILLLRNLGKILTLVILALSIASCRAGNPKITSLGNGASGSSTKVNLASAGGTATVGTFKIKFTVGYNTMGNAVGATSTVGTNRVKGTASGVVHAE